LKQVAQCNPFLHGHHLLHHANRATTGQVDGLWIALDSCRWKQEIAF
jgi:hypothetical protein